MSLPSQNVKATVYEVTTIDGDYIFNATGDFVVGKNGDTEDVNGAALTITENATFKGTSGNYETTNIAGGYSELHSVEYSKLIHNGIIKSKNIGGIENLDIYGGYSKSGNANYNEVTIKGSILETSVLTIYGGHVDDTGSSASSNSVTVDLGLLQNVSSQVNIYGGNVNDGIANNNTVRVKGDLPGNGNSEWYGGYVDNNGNANNNTFIFEDGTLKSFLIGIWSINSVLRIHF